MSKTFWTPSFIFINPFLEAKPKTNLPPNQQDIADKS